MNIDELIRESIDDAATSTGPAPRPDLEGIRHRGRRRSVARVGAAALTTLAVVAAGTYAIQNVEGTDRQDTVPASIPPNTIAFKTFGPVRAQFAGETYEPDHRTKGLWTSALTTAGVVYVSGKSNGTPYLMDRSGAETQLDDPVNPEDKPTWGSLIVTDADRSMAVWTADVPGPEIKLSLFSAQSRQVTDTITLDPSTIAEGAGGPWVVDVRTIHNGVVYGTVHGARFSQSFAWNPSLPKDQQIYKATDPNTIIATVGNGRVVVRGKGHAYGGPDQAPFAPSMRITQLSKRPDWGAGLQSYRLSPDGRWALVDPDSVDDIGAYRGGPNAGKSAEFAALNLDTGKLLPLRSPRTLEATFDDDGSVLVIELTPGGGHRLVDCTLPAQKCTTVIPELIGKSGYTTFID